MLVGGNQGLLFFHMLRKPKASETAKASMYLACEQHLDEHMSLGTKQNKRLQCLISISFNSF